MAEIELSVLARQCLDRRIPEREALAGEAGPWEAEQQELLAKAVADEETERASLEEMTKRHRVVFVLHREDLTGASEGQVR